MKIDRFSICQTPDDWRLSSNTLMDESLIKVQIYISDSEPIEFTTNIYVVEFSTTQELFGNSFDYKIGTALIDSEYEWRPPDDSSDSAFILCDSILSDRQTLQGNTQHGYKEFSNITIADL